MMNTALYPSLQERAITNHQQLWMGQIEQTLLKYVNWGSPLLLSPHGLQQDQKILVPENWCLKISVIVISPIFYIMIFSIAIAQGQLLLMYRYVLQPF